MFISFNSAKTLAVASNAAMWASVAMVNAAAADQAPAVRQEDIYVPLSVFVVSIIATAGFTWTVAKYGQVRDSRIIKQSAMIKRLSEELQELRHKTRSEEDTE